MRKVINIRGGKGSGKSTSILMFLKSRGYEHSFIEIQGKEYPIEISSGGVIALGRYTGKKCEGMDIVGVHYLIPMLTNAIKKLHPQVILYESAFLSHSKSIYEETARICKIFGYKFIPATFDVEYKKRIERLNGRKGSEVKTTMIRNGLVQVQNTEKSLKKIGILVRHYDVTNIEKEDYVTIIENLILC